MENLQKKYFFPSPPSPEVSLLNYFKEIYTCTIIYPLHIIQTKPEKMGSSCYSRICQPEAYQPNGMAVIDNTYTNLGQPAWYSDDPLGPMISNNKVKRLFEATEILSNGFEISGADGGISNAVWVYSSIVAVIVLVVGFGIWLNKRTCGNKNKGIGKVTRVSQDEEWVGEEMIVTCEEEDSDEQEDEDKEVYRGRRRSRD